MASATTYRLKLYVTGGTSAAERAISALRRLCGLCACRIQSEVVDVLGRPDIFFDSGLSAVPVFVRVKPDPVMVYKGCPADVEEVARALGIE